MPVLAVIPARLGATRLPRKPLRLLAGAPLIVRVWERVCALDVAERVVVATEDAEILDAVTSAGGEGVLTGQRASGTERVAEVAARKEYADYDVIVNVQGDEPFVAGEAVEGSVAMVRERGFPLGTAAAHAPASILDDPNVVKVVAAGDGRALYFSRAPIPFLRDERDARARGGLVRQHVGVYVYTREALARWVSLPPHPLEEVERLEQLRPLAAGLAMGVAMIEARVARGIDTEDDLAWANEHWGTLSAGRL